MKGNLKTISAGGVAFVLGFSCLETLAVNQRPLIGDGSRTAYAEDEQDPEMEITTDSIPTILDELVVEGKKDVIRSDGATLTYNIQEDPSAASSTVLDILRKVPMVSVDGNENIRIKGDSNYRIYVNGREDPMLSQNASTILKNMPASAVAKVEVITEPGARYDAEGTAGILNIVLATANTTPGNDFGGQLSANLSRSNSSVSAFVSGRKDKVTVSISGTYSNGHLFPQHSESVNEIFYHSPHLKGRDVREQSGYSPFDFGNAALNLSWEPDEKNLITMSANYYGVTAKLKDFHDRSLRYNDAEALLWSYKRDYFGHVKNSGITGNAAYQHSFSPTHSLIFSYQFNFGRTDVGISSAFKDLNNYTPSAIFQSNGNDDLNREHTLQADYSNALSDGKHFIEAGVKAVWRHNGNFSSVSYSNPGTVAGLLAANDSFSAITQIQNVYATYGSWTGHFGKFSTTAGLRYEYTNMGIDYKDYNGTDFRTHLSDLVPNASLSWAFGPATALRLAYQMRISRPAINQVNPFRQELTETQVQTGNPDLDSERTNQLSLTFSKFGRILGGNIGIEAAQTSNTIASLVYSDNASIVNTFANLGNKKDIKLNGFLNVNATQSLSFNINGEVGYVYQSAPAFTLDGFSIQGQKMCGWHTNWSASANYKLPKDWNVSAYGGWSSKNLILQGWYSGWYYYGLNLSHDFLPTKELTLALNADNFFQDRTSHRSYSVTPESTSMNSWKGAQWNIGISLTWKFGKNQQVKKVASSIVNDDVTKKSQGTGGGVGGGL